MRADDVAISTNKKSGIDYHVSSVRTRDSPCIADIYDAFAKITLIYIEIINYIKKLKSQSMS